MNSPGPSFRTHQRWQAAASAQGLEQDSWSSTLMHQLQGARHRAMLAADIDRQQSQQEEVESESEDEAAGGTEHGAHAGAEPTSNTGVGGVGKDSGRPQGLDQREVEEEEEEAVQGERPNCSDRLGFSVF